MSHAAGRVNDRENPTMAGFTATAMCVIMATAYMEKKGSHSFVFKSTQKTFTFGSMCFVTSIWE